MKGFVLQQLARTAPPAGIASRLQQPAGQPSARRAECGSVGLHVRVP